METAITVLCLIGVPCLILGVVMLLWALVWYPLKAAIWGEWNEEELPVPTDEDNKRIEEMMSSRFGKDWREKIINGKI